MSTTTKGVLLNAPGGRYRVTSMKTASTTDAAANPMRRYPRGRWTISAIRPTNAEQHPGVLPKSFDGSALMVDVAERLATILEESPARRS